ncbi:MAG TPA: hypothetical protein DDZ80_06945 [Cyanobacteria bacterium UBA8803]|nr:hypothetical protein [Cyanobacteria bacterium UBA9273]HBL58256.1 hypothetical protein [Cyanobacteria bacterium UBA8803]
MFNNYYQLLLQKIRTLYSGSRLAVIVLLLLWCTSCSSKGSPDIKLQFEVQPAGRSGLYSVTGNTNLPNQSQIIVAALRYLRPLDQEWLDSEPNLNYAILDRKLVWVKKGKWETTLNLWQVAPDGRLQEAWQIAQARSGTSLDPAPEVSFVATFEPEGQLPTSENEKTSENKKVEIPELEGSLVRFTNEGQPYVKASQTLRVPLPSGRRPPTEIKPEDINDGWGNRYQLKPEPKNLNPIPQKNSKDMPSQTTAPLSPSEFLR